MDEDVVVEISLLDVVCACGLIVEVGVEDDEGALGMRDEMPA